MLQVKNIDVFYGEVQALHDVSLSMAGNEIIAIIGANGAGKTTLLKLTAGELELDRFEGLGAHHLVALGLQALQLAEFGQRLGLLAGVQGARHLQSAGECSGA